MFRTLERERIRTPVRCHIQSIRASEAEASRLSEDLQNGDRSVARKHSKTCTSANAESTLHCRNTLNTEHNSMASALRWRIFQIFPLERLPIR